MNYKEITIKTYPDGSTFWYLNGKLHRDDGPATEYSNGSKSWWTDGKWNREAGPAVVQANGSKYWYKNGSLHREDGPAVVLPGGYESWFINGEKLTKEQFESRTSSRQLVDQIDETLDSLTGYESSVLLTHEDAKVVHEAKDKDPTEQLKADYAKFKDSLDVGSK